MKFFISFFITLNAWAGPIRMFHEGSCAYVESLRLTLTEEYAIPEELIQIEAIENCSDLKERGKLDLCLKNNGDLLVVSVDRAFVSESLKIFKAP